MKAMRCLYRCSEWKEVLGKKQNKVQTCKMTLCGDCFNAPQANTCMSSACQMVFTVSRFCMVASRQEPKESLIPNKHGTNKNQSR